MYNKDLVSSSIQQIQSLLSTISERTDNIKNVDDFLSSPNGMILLDAVCMNLIALGDKLRYRLESGKRKKPRYCRA